MSSHQLKNQYILEKGESPDYDLYIVQDLILPGDVLLTRSSLKESAVIATPTGGPFSHAAIIIDSSHKFESRTVGVGYKALVTHRIEKTPTKRIRLSKLDDSDVALVLRHPILGTYAEPKNLSEKLRNVVSPFFGLEYPEIEKLAMAVSRHKIIQELCRYLFRALDGLKHNKKTNAGPFCSQLVARIYEIIGYPLFPGYLPPEYVSPNRLLSSILQPVVDAICYPDFSRPNDIGQVNDLWDISRYDASVSDVHLQNIVEGKAITKTFSSLTNELSNALDEITVFFQRHSTSGLDEKPASDDK